MAERFMRSSLTSRNNTLVHRRGTSLRRSGRQKGTSLRRSGRQGGGDMRAVVSAACLAAVLALLAPSTSAQWTRYPTRNVPKDAKGQPDMNAPTPRTAD